MKLTAFGVAVLEGDLLSSLVERAGTLACADGWLQSFRHLIPDGGVVADIGAALGDHTASYAAFVGPKGTVHAVEPYGPFLECLRYNAQAMPNVIVHPYAACATAMRGDMVTSDVQPDNLGMTSFKADTVGDVLALPFDDLGCQLDRLDFVKIDVEGMEPLVLDGAVQTLERFHPALLIEVNAWALAQHGFTPDDVYRRVRALGYTMTPTRPGDTLQSPEIDILCVPRSVPLAAAVDSSLPRVHLLAVPNTQTTAGYELDGFCTRTMHFAALLKRLGHEVILYAGDENTAPCDTLVQCISKAEQQAFIGATPYQTVDFNGSTPLFLTFNTRASAHIRSVKRPTDIIATIAGSAQMLVAEHHPELRFLEFSIGYRGVAAGAFRVFESTAWQHVVAGFTGVDSVRSFDAVIPPWFPVEDFPFCATPDPYVVFCGRLTPTKGLHVACEVAQMAGVPLKIIGHGDPKMITYGEYLGSVTTEERNRVLSRATACLMPTQYIEPFGNVSAEAQLCGTPVISTDMGGFIDSVEPGVSGYRCNTLGEFIQAVDLARSLDRRAIRARAERLYSCEAADASYRAYFRRLEAVRTVGWRDLTPSLSVSAEGVLV